MLLLWKTPLNEERGMLSYVPHTVFLEMVNFFHAFLARQPSQTRPQRGRSSTPPPPGKQGTKGR